MVTEALSVGFRLAAAGSDGAELPPSHAAHAAAHAHRARGDALLRPRLRGRVLRAHQGRVLARPRARCDRRVPVRDRPTRSGAAWVAMDRWRARYTPPEVPASTVDAMHRLFGSAAHHPAPAPARLGSARARSPRGSPTRSRRVTRHVAQAVHGLPRGDGPDRPGGGARARRVPALAQERRRRPRDTRFLRLLHLHGGKLNPLRKPDRIGLRCGNASNSFADLIGLSVCARLGRFHRRMRRRSSACRRTSGRRTSSRPTAYARARTHAHIRTHARTHARTHRCVVLWTARSRSATRKRRTWSCPRGSTPRCTVAILNSAARASQRAL
jgi:hypothetical protein